MQGKTTRTLRINGKTYDKGDRITLPDDEFVTLESCGAVERARPKPAKEIAK